MKAILRILILLLIAEFVCFALLFKYLVNHDNDMFRRNVISDAVFKRRKQDNVFSGVKEVTIFSFKIAYLAFFVVVEMIGEKQFGASGSTYLLEYAPYARTLEFAIISTIQLLAVRQIRLKIFQHLPLARACCVGFVAQLVDQLFKFGSI